MRVGTLLCTAELGYKYAAKKEVAKTQGGSRGTGNAADSTEHRSTPYCVLVGTEYGVPKRGRLPRHVRESDWEVYFAGPNGEPLRYNQ